MNTMKRDNATVTVEGESETSQGVKRLQLSVTRMKKLRAGVKGGPVQSGSTSGLPTSGAEQPNGTAPTSWVLKRT